MELFKFVSGETILLVGEGNFSFSLSLLRYNESITAKGNVSMHQSAEIISSCFEIADEISEFGKRNADQLSKSGVTVLFGVDATKLKSHPVIGCKTFNKIIFNFPHVGGKMKINLNRQLLLNFFQSAKVMLNESGEILLTLCNGQGGTGADSEQRKWNDSWKVVEMAAEADFALTEVEPFIQNYFPGYIATGYRSLQKEFNTSGSLVHIFKSKGPPLILNCSLLKINSLFENQTVESIFGSLNIPNIYARKICRNPFKSVESPQSYLYLCFKNILLNDNVFVDNPYIIYGVYCCNNIVCDAIKKYFNKIPEMKHHSLLIVKGLQLSKLTEDFSQQPVNCEIICVGSDSLKCSKLFINEVGNIFGMPEITFNENLDEVTHCKQYYIDGCKDLCVITCYKGSDEKPNVVKNISVISLDNLALYLFNSNNWREVWAEGTRVVVKDKIELLTPCLYPSSYTFDITLSVTETFLQQSFFDVLWNIAGDMIYTIELISVYKKPSGACRNFCYRLKYKSYEVPLFRKRVIFIQHNIIAKVLQDKLNVIILQ